MKYRSIFKWWQEINRDFMKFFEIFVKKFKFENEIFVKINVFF
jgi:hypothetical protein